MIRVLSHRWHSAGEESDRYSVRSSRAARAIAALPMHKSESSGVYRLQADTAAAASVTPARAVSRP